MKQYLHSFVCKCLPVTLFLSLCFQSSFSQYGDSDPYWEAGITIGPSNFLGDLGGNAGKGTTFLKDNNFPQTKLMFGVFAAYQAAPWLGFRFAVNFGRLEADDAEIKSKGGWEEYRKVRNTNFRSAIQEGIAVAEFYPTALIEYDPTDVFFKLRPYGVIGVGVFHFNPQGTDPNNGDWVDLQPLHTEGQGFEEYPDRKEYKLTQLNIPMGVGLKYFLSDKVNLSFEILHRKTFTDYIDDVSTRYIDPALFYKYMPTAQAQLAERMANKTGQQNFSSMRYYEGDKRGTATNNDAYYSMGFKLAIRLGSNNRWSNSTRCPIRF